MWGGEGFGACRPLGETHIIVCMHVRLIDREEGVEVKKRTSTYVYVDR
jgi:hypothetical protein